MSEILATHPLVSLIVPVYDVEPYLRECVDSILGQTYANLEVILVDDGSPDGCGAICDEYEKRDSRVVTLHKENGGLSDARNYGLRRARGEWVSFIDSDDYVSPMFIEALLVTAVAYGCAIAAVPGGTSFRDGERCALEAGVCPVVPTKTDNAGDKSLHPVNTLLLDARDALEKILYQEMATGAQWRLYRRDVLGADPFPVGLYYEDLASAYRFVHHSGMVAVLETKGLYAYRMRSSSIIRQAYRPIKARSALVVAKQLKEEITSWYPDLAAAVASRCFSVCRMVFAQVPVGGGVASDTRRDRDSLWKTLKENRRIVLRDPRARKRERFAAAISLLGEGPFVLFCIICRRFGLMQ